MALIHLLLLLAALLAQALPSLGQNRKTRVELPHRETFDTQHTLAISVIRMHAEDEALITSLQGVLWNQKGYLWTLRRSAAPHEASKIERSLGRDRVARELDAVRSIRWRGQLASAGSLEPEIAVDLISPASAPSFQAALEQAWDQAIQTERWSELQVDPHETGIVVRASFSGLADSIGRYFAGVSL